jgi:hypothetical protein
MQYTFKELAEKYNTSITVIYMIMCKSEFVPYVVFSPSVEYSTFTSTIESSALLRKILGASNV